MAQEAEVSGQAARGAPGSKVCQLQGLQLAVGRRRARKACHGQAAGGRTVQRAPRAWLPTCRLRRRLCCQRILNSCMPPATCACTLIQCAYAFVRVSVCRYELGRQPAMTKLSSNVCVRSVRVRGGNSKFRALRLDHGNFSWGSEVRACICSTAQQASSRPTV